MTGHNVLGKIGEDIATDYLVKQGYHIRHRNWRKGHNELDIVAEKDGTLAIVEVKTRRNNAYGEAYEAVDDRKIRNIMTATEAYLQTFELDMPVRFDIIAITGNADRHQIDHIESAFYPPLW